MPLVRAAHLSPAQVPTCCCLRTINIERFEQMEGGGGANEDGSGELAAIPYGKVQEQCNFDTTCCLATKYRAMFETDTCSRVCVGPRSGRPEDWARGWPKPHRGCPAPPAELAPVSNSL